MDGIFDITILTELSYDGQNYIGETGTCVFCGGETCGRGKNNETNETFWAHRRCIEACDSSKRIAKIPFPVQIQYRKNIRNSYGIGSGFFQRTPDAKFFAGLSGDPRKKEKVDFSSHILYCALWRAKKEGLIK